MTEPLTDEELAQALKEMHAVIDITGPDEEGILSFGLIRLTATLEGALATIDARDKQNEALIRWADAMAACPELRECCGVTVREYTKFRRALTVADAPEE